MKKSEVFWYGLPTAAMELHLLRQKIEELEEEIEVTDLRLQEMETARLVENNLYSSLCEYYVLLMEIHNDFYDLNQRLIHEIKNKLKRVLVDSDTPFIRFNDRLHNLVLLADEENGEFNIGAVGK